MNNSLKIIIWLVLAIIFLGIYYLQKRRSPTFIEFANLVLASGGLVTSLGLLYSMIFSESVKQILEKEIGFDITGLFLGAVAVGWVSLQPIAQLLQPNSFVGTVADCYVSTGTIIYLEMLCTNQETYRVVVTEDLIDHISVKNGNIRTSLSALRLPDDLMGKTVSVFDIPSISTGNNELRITLPKQLLIKY